MLLVPFTSTVGPAVVHAEPDEGGRASAAVEIAMVGAEPATAPVREVTGELLSRDGIVASWRRLDWLRAEDILETGIGLGSAPTFVWIDLSSTREARLYFRAAAGQRFVIRRVALPGAVSPLEVEEIAQIVHSVLRALAADASWALSLPEARVALRPPDRSRSPVATTVSGRQALIAVGAAVIGQSYAPQLAFTGQVEVSVAVLSGRAGSTVSSFPAAIGGGLALGYGWPVRFSSAAVGAELQVATLRVELLCEPVRTGRWAIRLGAGGGVDRATYTPRAESPGATAASSGSFLSPLGALDASLHVQVSPRVALTLGFLAQIYLQRVHYDAYAASGRLDEVLVPHRLRPGATLGAEIRL